MKFVVFSLGCKVNQYEGRSMINELIRRGHEATDELVPADVYIINTCSVTLEADKKSRQAVARALRLNPDAQVIICGCSSQNDPKPYLSKKNVTIVGGSSGKMELIESTLSHIVQGECVKKPPLRYEDDLTYELTNSRGFIKVQDGCDNFCSYCIIPYLRGRSRSRALSAVVAEAEELAGKTKEIVITGINVSAYGIDIGSSLYELVEALGKIPVRKRFGSLECTAIDERLLFAMRDGGWCDFFHLSLQSGSDRVLKKMNRHYTSAEFNEKCDSIRKVFPNAGISTDVITGFPTETEEDFSESVALARRVGFSKMHVFPYSVRPGTAAANMPQLPMETRLDRAGRLREVAAELSAGFVASQVGRTAEVFVEEEKDGAAVGYTSNYVKVYVAAAHGELVKCRLTRPFRDGIRGERV